MHADVAPPRDSSAGASAAVAGSSHGPGADARRHSRGHAGPRTPYASRALTLWPRLDAAGLARAGGDPRRIAALVARRSSLPVEVIAGMLAGPAADSRRPAEPTG